MSFTYTGPLGLKLPSDGDTDHGEELRENFTALAAVSAPDHVYWVSPAFTEAEMFSANATDRRHYDTIQGAITAAQSASAMTGVRPTIFVYPGSYAEKLTITGTVGIIGLVPQLFYGYGAARGVQITGDGTNSSVITWTPADSVAHSLTLANLCIENSYATATATLISSSAYAVMVNQQSTLGSASNRLSMLGCQIRAQTYGDNNKWGYCIGAFGWNSVLVRDCAISTFGYAGGESNGGVAWTFNMDGTNNASYVSSLRVSRTQIQSEWLGDGITPTIFRATEYVNTTVTFSAFDLNTADAVYLDGGTGTQTFAGMKSLAEIDTYQNIEGVMPFPM